MESLDETSYISTFLDKAERSTKSDIRYNIVSHISTTHQHDALNTLLLGIAYTAHGAKLNFLPVLANLSLSLEIQSWILASISGSIFLMFEKLYFGKTISLYYHCRKKVAYGSCHDLPMMSMLLVFLHTQHALHRPKTGGDVVIRLIDITIVYDGQECRIAEYK